MIYGFILDNAFVPTDNSILTTDSLITHGYLKREQYSYFLKPNNLKDPRTTRLHMFSEPLTSKMELIWDEDESNIDPSILEHIRNSDVTYRECFFNIVEFLFYRTVNFTKDELNDELVNDNDSFSNYIPNSLEISVKTNEAYIYDNAETSCNIEEWVQFSIDINGHIIDFKLWINNESFQNEYPLSHITEVIFPMAQSDLLDPSGIENIYAAINRVFSITSSKLNPKISSGNHTGYTTFMTKYITPDEGLYEVPFAILYKGRMPSSLEMRDAIRAELDYYLADEPTWKSRLPDLFIDGRFYVIPIWDYEVEEPNRTTRSSLISLSLILDKLSKVMYEFNRDYIIENMELISVAYIESLIGIIPDPSNISDTKVSDRHPLYQYYGTHESSYNYQPPLTKEFSRKLNQILPVALGLSTTSELAVETIDGRNFLVFIVDGLEFLVITEDSYNRTIYS